jgi:RecB family exonuclease
MQHQTRKHARLSASRIDRIMRCPGSYRLESQMPYEPPGEAAERGTAIHELAEKLLRGEEIDNPDVDHDYITMAKQYADFVNGYFRAPRKKLIEVNVDEGLKSIHLALGGTADAILVEGNTLACVDLKTGRIPVDAKDNKQLMTYALGAMRQLKAPLTIDVHLVIFQPGVGNSVHQISGLELLEHGLQLKKAAELALSLDAPTNPSTDACRYCRAKTICPSIRQKVQDAARNEFKADTSITSELIELAQLAASWAESVIDTAKQQLRANVPIDGWTLRPGRKTMFWKDEALAKEALRGNELAFDIKSPSAIKKLGIEVGADLIGEKHAAESLVKQKPQA